MPSASTVIITAQDESIMTDEERRSLLVKVVAFHRVVGAIWHQELNRGWRGQGKSYVESLATVLVMWPRHRDIARRHSVRHDGRHARYVDSIGVLFCIATSIKRFPLDSLCRAGQDYALQGKQHTSLQAPSISAHILIASLN